MTHDRTCWALRDETKRDYGDGNNVCDDARMTLVQIISNIERLVLIVAGALLTVPLTGDWGGVVFALWAGCLIVGIIGVIQVIRGQ